ncbi:hypothetical protein SBA4_1400020 [Candidatus Sulfopaludibacter sp. SbA4]|nr:hypothetical protein SBA4_1400020 [Candidatus Sulfopaludibacter sp. SbA4]
MLHLQEVAGAALDDLGDGVTVGRSPGERLEHEHVEGSLEHFTLRAFRHGSSIAFDALKEGWQCKLAKEEPRHLYLFDRLDERLAAVGRRKRLPHRNVWDNQ